MASYGKSLLSFFFLFLALSLAACSRSERCSVCADSADEITSEPLSVEEIARRAELALQQPKYIEVTAVISQSAVDGSWTRQPITILFDGTVNAFLTRIYDAKGICDKGYALSNHRMQEYFPVGTGYRYEYPSPYINGTDDSLDAENVRPTDCMSGNFGYTPLGDFGIHDPQLVINRPAELRKKIEGCVFDSVAWLGCHHCFVVKHKSLAVEHVYYIDMETFLLAGWDTTQTKVKRERRFEMFASDKPRDIMVPQDLEAWRALMPPDLGSR